MGVVFEVEHELIGRRLALKTLHAELADDPNVLARFQREARAAGSIGHQNIIEITDMGVLPEGTPFIVLELLDGHDLGQEIRTFGALSIPRAIDIAIQCCRALHAAHEKAVVHRDLKPDNVFLVKGRDRPDFVKILDFGVSKFLEAANRLDGHATTRTGRTVGTPYYMSPEQCQGSRDIDRRVDVYAVGVVLFEMLTGRRPFAAPHFPALAIKIMQDPRPSLLAERPAVPVELEQIVHRAMAAKAADRFPTAADLADALAPFGDPERRSEPAPPTETSPEDTATFISPMKFDPDTGSAARVESREPIVRTKSPVPPKEASDAGKVVPISVDASQLPELGMSKTDTEAASVHRIEIEPGASGPARVGTDPVDRPSDTERNPVVDQEASKARTEPPQAPASTSPAARAVDEKTGPVAASAAGSSIGIWIAVGFVAVAAFLMALYLPRCG